MPLSITGKKCTHRPPTSRSPFSRPADDELLEQSTLPFTFSNNKLTGRIPEDIGFMTNMKVLDFSFNSFTGHLPTSISCLSDIQVFNIAHNQISGVLPDVVCSMRSLVNLTISFNFFSRKEQSDEDGENGSLAINPSSRLQSAFKESSVKFLASCFRCFCQDVHMQFLNQFGPMEIEKLDSNYVEKQPAVIDTSCSESRGLQPKIHSPNDNTAVLTDSSDISVRVCNVVCQCYEDGDRKLETMQIGHDLSPEQASTVISMLIKKEGSVVGMSFFTRAISYVKFRYVMRFYITATLSFINHGNLEKAQELMRCMASSFAEVGKLRESVDMIFEMQNQGLPLSIHTLNWALRIAANMEDTEFAEYLFAEIRRYKVSLNFCSFKTMLNAYSRKGRVIEVEKIFKEMIARNHVIDNATCTLVVNALCEMGHTSKVFELFAKMQNKGLTPNIINYTAFINQLCKKGNVKQAFQLLEEMVGKGIRPNVYTHTMLIDGLCKIGWTEKAFRLFLKLVRSESYKPNVYTYTAMIGGYCKESKMSRAEMLLSRMQEQGLAPNTTTYTTLIAGHCKDGNLQRAFNLMHQMNSEDCVPNICTYNVIAYSLLKKRRVQEAYRLLKLGYEHGLKPDKFTYTILIGEHCKQEDITMALDLFYQMIKCGFQPDIYAYNTLISMFCKLDRIEDSKKLLNDALKIDLIPTKQTCTSMIAAYCRNSDVSSALDLFEKMPSYGSLADSVTYCALISGLCKESRLEEAKKLYDLMIDKGLTPCDVTCVTLVFEYCIKKDSSVAMFILNKLDRKQWSRIANILVRKLSSKRLIDSASSIFHMLLGKDKNIDRITYVAFVNACYENDRYSIVSDLSEKISAAINR
ncbi:putative Pentatricopeptide repeat-containing protein [Zostera marina]|uniref:Putative Pentatricopeptide repeat-containing protein n=1 Tax=Zostera marina TaxID=29655 RepID=A0A0K9NLE1_ZOSMR|nr:putative Pentatricopeptide repeat-containing protein [Zostera marina]